MKNVKTFENVTGEWEGYTVKEIFEGVISGKIQVDMKGHNELSVKDKKGYMLEYCTDALRDLNEYIKDLQGRPDKAESRGIPKEKSEEINKIVLGMVNRKFHIGDITAGSADYRENLCWDCGCYTRFVILSKNKVSLMDKMDYYELKKSKGIGGRPLVKGENPKQLKLKDSDISNCPTSQSENYRDGAIVTNISVPTGKLVIVNHFGDHPEIYTMPNEYKTENSINNIGGRINLAKHLSTKNVGYGQMGNMSITVFGKEDGTEIIFAEEYGWDENDYEISREYPGFKNLGSISLGVWRWMCADMATLNKYDVNVEDIKNDVVITDVKPGNWIIEHYYDIQGGKDGVYSKLYLDNRGLFEK